MRDEILARVFGVIQMLWLGSVPIFAPLPGMTIEHLAGRLIPLRLEPGTVVVREGDPGDRFFIVAEGTVESLREQLPGTVISFRRPDVALPEGIRESTSLHDGVVTIDTNEPTKTLHHLTSWASEAGIDLAGLRVVPTSLEDVYFRLVEPEQTGRDE